MSTPQPGWYPDPQNPSAQRWWDGAAWTEHRSAPAPGYASMPAAYAGPPAAPVGFGDAVRLGFRKYAAFDGRANRPEFWWWYLFEVLAILPFYLLMLIAAASMPTDSSGSASGGSAALLLVASLLLMVIALALLLPTIAVMVRRLHDTGRSGWWYWISLVPFIGGIWLIVLLVGESQPGPNQYGPPSEGAAALGR